MGRLLKFENLVIFLKANEQRVFLKGEHWFHIRNFAQAQYPHLGKYIVMFETGRRVSIIEPLMFKFEDVREDAQVRKIQGDDVVSIIQTEPVGDNAITAYSKDPQDRRTEQTIFLCCHPEVNTTAGHGCQLFDVKGLS